MYICILYIYIYEYFVYLCVYVYNECAVLLGVGKEITNSWSAYKTVGLPELLLFCFRNRPYSKNILAAHI